MRQSFTDNAVLMDSLDLARPLLLEVGMFTPLIFDAISSPTCVSRLLGVVAFAGPGEAWTLTLDREGFPLRLDPGLRPRAPRRRDHLFLLVHVVHSIAAAPTSALRARQGVVQGGSAGAAASRVARRPRTQPQSVTSSGTCVDRNDSRARFEASPSVHCLDEIVLAPDGTWSRRYESPLGRWAPAPFWRVASARERTEAP